jgi:hypothetical protein
MGERIVQVSEVNYLVEIVETPPCIVHVMEQEPSVGSNGEINVRVEVSPPILNVVEAPEIRQTVSVSQTGIQVVETGVPGPPGPPGTGGEQIITDYLAGQALGGQRVVIVGIDGKLYYADCTNLAHLNRVLGVTTGAAEPNAPAIVRAFGIMTEPAWNWDLSKFIYLGTNGLLTQAPPPTGFLLELGWPVNPTSMMVQIELPILLA